jgi:probable rRNA maturation factor
VPTALRSFFFTAKPLILNQQDKYVVNTSRLGEYVRELRQALRLGKRDCNVCLVDDREIRRLNWLHLGKDRATDVLSFPWNAHQRRTRSRARSERARPRYARRGVKERAALEFKNFLGDIVISVDTAERNARQEGHSTLNELLWLILHGLLHLLGYDHESDQGEMTKLELALRRRLGITED